MPTFDNLELAATRRRQLFSRLGAEVGAVISCNTGNKDYLSGYHSMTHDIAPDYISAVVATRDKAVLVVSASDAAPAWEALKDPGCLFPYGTFYFEPHTGTPPLGFDKTGYRNFAAALDAALAATAPKGARVGVDRSRAGPMEKIVADRYGQEAIVSVGDDILAARRIKLPGEVEMIRHATKLVESGIDAIAAQGRVGMTEFDIAALVSERIAAGGAVPRLVSVTSGPRSALANAYPTDRVIEAGDLVRLDASCFVGPFCSDMARTFVMGEPSAEIARLYNAIAMGLEEELVAVKAGARIADVYAAAMEGVRKAGIPSYRRHHCGHGLGIGGYEEPIIVENSDLRMEADMCFCLETPYYRLGWGGMMVEDTILVTETGYEPVTTIPRKLYVL
jgi:Xaa-Pro aminopeptidase